MKKNRLNILIILGVIFLTAFQYCSQRIISCENYCEKEEIIYQYDEFNEEEREANDDALVLKNEIQSHLDINKAISYITRHKDLPLKHLFDQQLTLNNSPPAA